MSSINEKALTDCKILVVDDMDFNVIMIKHLLNKFGFNNIYTANNGLVALEVTRKENPDLIILDLMMPEMDGFEYCTIIRKETKFASLPIIVQTATNLSRQKNQAFSCGATDFISKPIDPDELMARIKVHLENHILLEKLQAYQEKLRLELLSAQKMQEALMPSKLMTAKLLDQYGIKIHSYFLPSLEIGGDFWSFEPIDDDKVSFHITDFSGHGIGSAINTFRLHTIISELKSRQLNISSSEAVNHVNHVLSTVLSKGQFATMFYGIIDLKDDQLEFASCGAPTAFIINIADKSVVKLDSTGLPVGISQNYIYNSRTASFKKGDILFCYSDALIETEDLHGNIMGFDNLERILSEYLSKHNAITSEHLYNYIMDLFTSDYMQRIKDDYTIVFYERTR